jgi:isopentenyldiphosphate isomerase
MDKQDEILDLLNEQGEIIGTIPRGECHGDPGKRHRASHILVRNGAGNYFLQKRSTAKKIQPGKWDSSVGGHVPSGESYEQGALRELSEELGVQLSDDSRLQFAHDYVWQSPVETEHVRTYILEHEGPFNCDPEEIEEGRFWSVAEMRAAQGSGELSPNLEEELRKLGVI